MGAMEIKRDQWVKFFDDFSKKHEGWIVTLEVIGSDLGDQEEANGLPLVGISADLKDRENRLEIITGGRPDADVTRFVDVPKHVWVKTSNEPGDEAVEIESDDGTRTLLTFHHIGAGQTERQLPA
jgi:hypothetical protein